jgi:ribonuclease R
VAKAARKKKQNAALPTREQVVDFIRESTGAVGKREIAREFNLHGAEKIALKTLLNDLKHDGLLDGSRKRGVRPAGSLPNVTVVDIRSISNDGEMHAEPVKWEADTPPPIIEVLPDGRRAPGVGDRLLVKLTRDDDSRYTARIIRRIERSADTLLGVFEPGPNAGTIDAVDRRIRFDVIVPNGQEKGAKRGELVLAEFLPGRPMGARAARVMERYGRADGPQAISLIAIRSHDIPQQFSPAALDGAKQAKPVSATGRADLRKIPLVTIDGADARDFDDAVWAAPSEKTKNPGGWTLIVAIADVAHYVRPGSALDKDAYERGNSVYFPDRVVPMLPEALSNDLCSLRPKEDRGCVAAHMEIDSEGRLLSHKFERAIMRSAARFTYDQVQAAADGVLDDETGPLLDNAIKPLYGAFQALRKGRLRRGTLEIEMPERKVILDDKGAVKAIAPVARLDSHRLIEEFMITANVAAAENLERRNLPCMYRIHEPPDMAGLEALRTVLHSVNLTLSIGHNFSPDDFNKILVKTRGTPHAQLVSEMVLRAQSKAVYSPGNRGHFGLSLPRYAHFTSPIRRYSDLLVHRALVGGKADELPDDAAGSMDAWGEHISQTERRAMVAERDTKDRYAAAFHADNIGADFAATVSGVIRAGLFVTLTETGASGLVPASMLPGGRWRYDEKQQALVGDRSSGRYRLGQAVQVRLREANPLTGSLVMEVLTSGSRTEDTSLSKSKPRKTKTKAKLAKGKRKKREKQKAGNSSKYKNKS